MNRACIENALSFDVEDYFQVSAFEGLVRYEDWGRYESRVVASTARILDLLAARGTRATFFVLGWAAERHPELVRRIVERGHEVASHGYSHRLVYRMTPAEFREDARRSREVLEDQSGRPVQGFRAPSFSIVEESRWGLEVLAELGYRYDSSIFPVRHHRYGIPRHRRFPHLLPGGEGRELAEFPLSTVRLGRANLPVAGGGYLRLLSCRYIRWGLRRINAEGQPAILYFHPWELDPDQPRLPCGLLTRLRHYSGLSRTAEALKRLTGEFRFAPVAEVLASLGLLGEGAAAARRADRAGIT
jgi:polysaccharide deacetylase family protein (PEP-CTERM system associated)